MFYLPTHYCVDNLNMLMVFDHKCGSFNWVLNSTGTNVVFLCKQLLQTQWIDIKISSCSGFEANLNTFKSWATVIFSSMTKFNLTPVMKVRAADRDRHVKEFQFKLSYFLMFHRSYGKLRDKKSGIFFLMLVVFSFFPTHHVLFAHPLLCW